jgi:hypothetical protein
MDPRDFFTLRRARLPWRKKDTYRFWAGSARTNGGFETTCGINVAMSSNAFESSVTRSNCKFAESY